MKLTCVVLIALLLPAADALKVQAKHQIVAGGQGNKSADDGISEGNMLLNIMIKVISELGLGTTLESLILSGESGRDILIDINDMLVTDTALDNRLCNQISTGETDPETLLQNIASFFIGELSLDETMVDYIVDEEEEYMDAHPALKTATRKRKSVEDLAIDPVLVLGETGVQFWEDQGLLSELSTLLTTAGSWCDGLTMLVTLATAVIDNMGLDDELAALIMAGKNAKSSKEGEAAHHHSVYYYYSGTDFLPALIKWLIENGNIDDSMEDVFEDIYPDMESWWDGGE